MTNFLAGINYIDEQVQNIFVSFRNDTLDGFFFFITKLGIWYVILALFIFVSVLFYYYKKTNLILPFLIAVLGSGIMALIIKFLVDRSRPGPDVALYTEKLASFPSAHAALIFAFFAFLIFCFWKFSIALKIKIAISVFFVILIVLVGFSRIYLGVHFFSDVIAGYLTGLMWLLIALHFL